MYLTNRGTAKGGELPFAMSRLVIKVAIAMSNSNNRNVTGETLREVKGEQLSLLDTPVCSKNHSELSIEQGMKECPSCGATISNRQTAITEF